LSPEQAASYARGLTYRQARPVLAELEHLQAEGKIADFEVRPELHGVVVREGTSEVPEWLSRLRDIAAVFPLKGGDYPSCAVAAAEALPEQVEGLSRVAAGAAARLRAEGPTTPQATDPSIDAYIGSTWSSVSGKTTPDTGVTMRILRGGEVIVTDSTTSDGGGYYHFYPSWHSCPSYGYDWTLRPGDVVEVTAHGNTVSTVVATLSAWMDPGTDIVAGRTDPGRSVEIWTSLPSSDLCSLTSYSQTVGTDSNGNFVADFTDQADFDRRASSYVYARDTNGNSTYAWFHAYNIAAEFNSVSFWGYLTPDTYFTATLSRAGSIVSTYNGRSDEGGYYYGWFTDTVRSGDVVRVSGGGVSVQYTATSLDATLDPTADRAVGTTGANRLVKAYFYKRTWGVLQTTCEWRGGCAGTTADGGGAFTLDTTLDLERGDYADFYVYDAEGNYQYAGERSIPAIVADLSWRSVKGYWGDPTVRYVTVTLKSSGGGVKDTQSWVWVYSWDGEFSTRMSSDIAPADVIEVTDGTVTETMTVQDLTARLSGSTGHLSGSAYNDHLVAKLWDFRRDYEYLYGYCSETDVTGGAYDLTFTEAQVGGQDWAEMWSRGPGGHYTYRGAHVFTVNARKGHDYVGGHTEVPYTPVTVTLQRGGSPIAVYTTTSYADGYYGGFLSGGTPVTITQGDTVLVQTGDGGNVSLPIPELTASADATNNRIYGKAPANDPVRPEAQRYFNWGLYSYPQNTTADSSGNYSASFSGLYWSRDCSAVDVGHRCSQVAVQYYNSAGHQVWWEGPPPQAVGPDIYESDDISTTARAYVGVQSHTFHTITDTDWVTFTVPQADVDGGVPYRIETFNLGWGMATRVRLYDTDGTTLLGQWTGYEYRGRGVSILWTPTATGTYYLEVSPPASDYAAYCDAVYDLMVLPLRGQIYLPMIARND